MKYKIHRESNNIVIYDLLDDSGNVVFANGVYEGSFQDAHLLLTEQIIPMFEAPIEEEPEEQTMTESEVIK